MSTVLDQNAQMMIVSRFELCCEMVNENIRIIAGEVATEHQRPSAVYRPALSKDGDQWCALYGDNLQDGVAGFGDTPAKAMADFDANWSKS